MAVKILISGLYPLDSGKTTLASSLVSILRREGFKVAGFKPVGSTDIWLHPMIIEESLKARAVVTRDGLILSKATGEFNSILLNPIGGILTPLDPRVVGWRESFLDFIMGNPIARLTLIRMTSCAPDETITRHYLNSTAYSRITKSLQESINDLTSVLRPPVSSISSRELAELMESEASSIADSCLEYLSEKTEVIVAESNADIAAPTRGLVKPDLALIIAQSVVALVNGLRYYKAIELRMRQDKPWSVVTREIASLLAPFKTIELPLKEYPEEGYTLSEIDEVVDEIKSLVKK